MLMQYLLFEPLQMVASYERRYEKTRAAMLGVTSSFDEQIEKITWVDLSLLFFFYKKLLANSGFPFKLWWSRNIFG